MGLQFYNTLTRKKEAFEPRNRNTAMLYHCGPTVYHFAHIGNLRAFVFADILRRTIEREGFSVKQIMNITDVGHLVSDADVGEDKMEKGARREGKSAAEIAKFYTDAFFHDIDALNIKRADIYPRATEHIPDDIALIERLEKKGYTYQTGDGIYFNTAKYREYGNFAKLDLKGEREGARVEKNPEKKNPSDFALWKFSPQGKKREQEWESPWGMGFPGWHVECSAMAMKYLGETIDIHTGGIDHIPVHHTNERAQSVCATGKPFSRFWMHSGFVNIAGNKMAKSDENFIRLQTFIDRGIPPLAYRYLLLTAHYRTTIQFSYDALKGAEQALSKIYVFLDQNKGTKTKETDQQYTKRFLEAIEDDLDTPKAIALLWEVFRDPNLDNDTKHATLSSFDQILGLDLDRASQHVDLTLNYHTRDSQTHSLGTTHSILSIPQDVQSLLVERETARGKKDFKESDRLRDKIERLGFLVNDTADGQRVKKKRSKNDA